MRRLLAATIICFCGGTAFAQLPTAEALGNRIDAINDNTEARFVMSGGRAEWSMVYIGGLMLDAKYRVN